MKNKFIIIGAVVILGAGAVFFSRGSAGSSVEPVEQPADIQANTAQAATSAQALAPREAPAGQSEYRNVQYHFSLFYPDTLTVKVFDEGDGASTITFQNPATAEGFQIFVLPYTGTQVSEAQFKKDEPSGVRQGAKNVAIDGATATSFYSTNASLGDTAEVWFIKGGYLFEVTTLKPLDAWLANIMQSWIFI